LKKKLAFYISVEGIDGVGKSTFVKNLYNYLLSLGKKVLLTKEFGSEHNEFCKKMRATALSSEYNVDELAGQIAFAAIARQHQKKVIQPNLFSNQYDFILSDRGRDSNFAYGPEHLDPNDRHLINKLFALAYDHAIKPDITFLLDAKSSFTKKRIAGRKAESFSNNGVDRVEQKGEEFQFRVRKNFIKIAKDNSERIKIIKITGETSPEDVLNKAITLLKKTKSIL
jgi:dTMP kinase